MNRAGHRAVGQKKEAGTPLYAAFFHSSHQFALKLVRRVWKYEKLVRRDMEEELKSLDGNVEYEALHGMSR